MTVPSLQAMALFEQMSQEMKAELSTMIKKEQNPGQPLWGGKTSLEWIKEMSIEYTVGTLVGYDINIYTLMEETDDRPDIPHYIVSNLLMSKRDDYEIYGLADVCTIMVNSLCEFLDHRYIENTMRIILATSAIMRFHKDIQDMYDRYTILHDRKKNHILTWDDVKDIIPNVQDEDFKTSITRYVGSDMMRDILFFNGIDICEDL